jgi:hypothetical protein
MPNSDVNIKAKATEIIHNYMGQTTAELYIKFYQDRDVKDVLTSVKALLEEYVGNAQAVAILDKNGLGGTE